MIINKRYDLNFYVDTEEIDNLVKEITDVEINQRKEDEGKWNAKSVVKK